MTDSRSILIGIALLTAIAGCNRWDCTPDFDPVAYFTEGEPRQGDPSIRADWHSTTWHFASEEHRALFEAEPERYAPQFGGYCAFGASTGTIVDGSPEVWTIVGDRLFLNANPVARRLMHALPGRLSAAYEAWPGLASQP